MILRRKTPTFIFLFCMISLSLCSSNVHLPTSHVLQGNKSRSPYKLQIERSGTGFYSAGCEERIISWAGWSGGLNGKILVKSAGDPELTTWSVVIQLDKSITKLQAYDATTDKVDDRTYKISPASWNAKVNEQAEKTVSVQLWWTAGEAEPNIRYIFNFKP